MSWLNYFFVNVAKDIRNRSLPVDENHSSVLKIKENNYCSTEFHFKNVDEIFTGEQIDK